MVHRTHPEVAEKPGPLVSSTASKALAVLRVATGFVFLWAFLDKTFGLHYSTQWSNAWLNGGSPTKGFLGSVDVGPLKDFFNHIAGTWYADWFFMLGLLGIGLALTLGIGLRVAAVAGTVMMAMMWLAEFPFAQHLQTGDPSGSTNPITDYHFIYAAVMIVLALTFAGDTWGFGRIWARLPLVQRFRWLR
jgi:thiosulfate dehydrogenase [quinone] large subunit